MVWIFQQFIEKTCHFYSGLLSEILVYLMLASLFTEKDAVQVCEENSRLGSSTDQTISDDPT